MNRWRLCTVSFIWCWEHTELLPLCKYTGSSYHWYIFITQFVSHIFSPPNSEFFPPNSEFIFHNSDFIFFHRTAKYELKVVRYKLAWNNRPVKNCGSLFLPLDIKSNCKLFDLIFWLKYLSQFFLRIVRYKIRITRHKLTFLRKVNLIHTHNFEKKSQNYEI